MSYCKLSLETGKEIKTITFNFNGHGSCTVRDSNFPNKDMFMSHQQALELMKTYKQCGYK